MATATKEKANKQSKAMKGTVSTELMNKYRPLLLRVVERKTTIPILSHYRLHAGGISASDLDLFITLDGAMQGDVDVCVPAHLFGKFIKLLEGDARITIGDDWQCEVASDSAIRAKMICVAPNNFPSFPDAPIAWERIDAGKFLAMTQKALRSISNEQSRYTLCAALYEANEHLLRMVSTDGHQMSVCEALCSDTAKKQKVLMSRQALSLLAEAIPLTQADHLLLSVDDSFVHYRVGPLTIHQKVMTGQFPNWQGVTAGMDSWSFVLTVDAAAMVKTITTAALFSDPRSRGVSFIVKDGKLTIFASDLEYGECSIDMPVELKDGRDISIRFNADYLVDFFSGVQGQIEIIFKDAQSAGLFRPKSSGSYQYIVMPMRF